MKKIGIIILLCILTIGIANAGIDNFSVETGSTYINWSWSYSGATTECAVHVDGEYLFDSSDTTYILSGLDSREEHSISLVNVDDPTDVYETDSAQTFYPLFIFYVLLLLGIIFFILSVLLGDVLIAIIIGALGFVMSISAFYFSFPLYFVILSYLSVGIAVLCLIWMLGRVFTYISESVDF